MGKKLFAWLLEWLAGKLAWLIQREVAGEKAENIGKENEEKLQDAIQSGDLDEIGKAAGNHLNGNRPD